MTLIYASKKEMTSMDNINTNCSLTHKTLLFIPEKNPLKYLSNFSCDIKCVYLYFMSIV